MRRLTMMLALLAVAAPAAQAQKIVPDSVQGHVGDTLSFKVVNPKGGRYRLRLIDAKTGKIVAGAIAKWDTLKAPPIPPQPPGVIAECSQPKAEWVWCDDFEQDRLAKYFEYTNANGNFMRTAGIGWNGSTGMRAHWVGGNTDAGSLHLGLGKVPSSYFQPVDGGTQNYRELYWRMYVRNQGGWLGGGADKLSRAVVFASSNWAQAAIAHVWSGSSAADYNFLRLDPASGTDAAGNLKATVYNDWDNLRWLGAQNGTLPLFDAAHVGQWYCVEAHAKLNTAGQTDGVFELWVNGTQQANRTGLNWLGSYNAYGWNAVFFENYWNAGSAATQERYFDNIVVSTARIGCAS